MSSHDEKYLRYLGKMFGEGAVPMFGVLLTCVSFVFIMVVILLNVAGCEHPKPQKTVTLPAVQQPIVVYPSRRA